ncbi:MAG TPA: hypothetical protein VMS81_07335 [Methanomicrobiales archaeon]|jgi:hypothetical protein|nr:hypothetical protein [Methanomicrobiales archaeon]
MAGKDKRRGIICRSTMDFERIFLPRSFERKEKEKVLKEPGEFGKSLEIEMILSIRKGKPSQGKEKK